MRSVPSSPSNGPAGSTKWPRRVLLLASDEGPYYVGATMNTNGGDYMILGQRGTARPRSKKGHPQGH
jgi:hypothetical protein